MKSVGEVMAIGRSFEEAVQKAARMLQIGVYGLVANANYSFASLERELRHPTDERLFGIAEAFAKGWSVDRVHELTRIDRWFLHKIRSVVAVEAKLKGYRLATLPAELLREAKRKGFSDKQIALLRPLERGGRPPGPEAGGHRARASSRSTRWPPNTPRRPTTSI